MFDSTWTVLWESTPEFERTEGTGGAHFVLFGGLLFTGLFAVLLFVFSARRQAEERDQAASQPWALPVATFVLVAGGSFAAYALLSNTETANVSSQVESETRRIEAELDRSIRSRLQSVRRMAHRWASGGGTPYAVWRNDARDLVRQVEGLEAAAVDRTRLPRAMGGRRPAPRLGGEHRHPHQHRVRARDRAQCRAGLHVRDRAARVRTG